MENETDEAITLRVYRTPWGKWTGRLFVGAEEIGVIAAYASPDAVEQAARETGVYPDRVEVY